MPDTKTKVPPCPRCGSNKHVVESGHRDHYCGNGACRITFNHDPAHDQFFHRDPAVHAERQDEFRERFVQRVNGRRS